MKKIFLIILACYFLTISGIVSEASEKTPALVIDGKEIKFNDSTGYPYVSDFGRTMMPLRICFTSIGCEVGWNQQTQTVVTSKSGIRVEIPIGKNEILINRKPSSIDTAAILSNGRSYLPLRSVLEAYGYKVNWDAATRTVTAVSNSVNNRVTPFNINGGTTGIFSRKQLMFEGFDGIQSDITLPVVTILEKGDCPYVYFGFDWKNDEGNAEGGFQFIEDPNHPGYNKWTVFLRQGKEWCWGNNIALDQGSVHHLRFYSARISDSQVDLVIELDGKEVIRKASSVTNFRNASVKAVTSMAMSKIFDGTNCLSRSENSRIDHLMVSQLESDQYRDFNDFMLYREWKSKAGAEGMWFGTAECIPSYLHYKNDGSLSIYKGEE